MNSTTNSGIILFRNYTEYCWTSSKKYEYKYAFHAPRTKGTCDTPTWRVSGLLSLAVYLTTTAPAALGMRARPFLNISLVYTAVWRVVGGYLVPVIPLLRYTPWRKEVGRSRISGRLFVRILFSPCFSPRIYSSKCSFFVGVFPTCCDVSFFVWDPPYFLPGMCWCFMPLSHIWLCFVCFLYQVDES